MKLTPFLLVVGLLVQSASALAADVTLSPIAAQAVQLGDKRAFTFEVSAGPQFKGTELNVVLNRGNLNGVDKDKEITLSAGTGTLKIAAGGTAKGKIVVESAVGAPSFDNGTYELILISDRVGNIVEAKQTVTLSVKPVLEFWMIGGGKWALPGDEEFGVRALPYGGDRLTRTFNLRTHAGAFNVVNPEDGSRVTGTGVVVKFVNYDEQGGQHITHGSGAIPHADTQKPQPPARLFTPAPAESIYETAVAARIGKREGYFYYHDLGPGPGSAGTYFINFNSK